MKTSKYIVLLALLTLLSGCSFWGIKDNNRDEIECDPPIIIKEIVTPNIDDALLSTVDVAMPHWNSKSTQRDVAEYLLDLDNGLKTANRKLHGIRLFLEKHKQITQDNYSVGP